MKNFILIIFLLVFTSETFAQTVEGPSSVSVGQTAEYRAYVGTNSGQVVVIGTLGSVLNSSTTNGYAVSTIRWGSTQGTDFVALRVNGATVGSKQVTIGPVCSVLTPSVTFSSDPNLCAPRTISYNGTPPSGISWYWQTSSTGTSMSFSGNTYSATYSGTYYLRAYNTSGGCWSGATAYFVSVNQIPGTPNGAISRTERCGFTEVTISGAPVSGSTITWHWGARSYNPVSNALQVFTAGRYAVTALNSSTNCWSEPLYFDVVPPNPITPPNTPTISSNACGSKTIHFNGTPPSGLAWYWQGTNPDAFITDYSSSSFPISSSGTYYVRARSGLGCWSAPVSVNVNIIPVATPNTPLVSTNTCGSKTLSLNGSPPTGYTWYWQGTVNNGTDISNSAGEYPAVSSGRYYLRARENSFGCWSDNSAFVDVIVNPIPTLPPTPSISSNVCGDKTVSFNGSADAGITWYWQGTNSDGYLTDNSSSSISVSTTNTYYLRALSSAGCWGPSRPVYVPVSVVPVPPIPSTTTNLCGPQTLTFNGTPSAGITWYWQDMNAVGTNTVKNTSPYTANVSGTYYLRARDNSGCWSSVVSVNVTVNPAPAKPSGIVNVSTNVCGAKTLTMSGTPSTNEYWFWQGTNPNGTSRSWVHSTAYTAYATGTHYVRSYTDRNSIQCWGESLAINVTVNDIPNAPAIPTVSTNTCGSKILTMGTPPAGTTWYWQGTASAGTLTTNSATTYTATVSGTYYLRARNNAGECWSGTSSSVNVTINTNPGMPSGTINVSSNTCGGKTISIVGPPPTNETWFWFGTDPNGASYTTATSPYTAWATGRYYIKSMNNTTQCWSDPFGIDIVVNDIPITPAAPTATTNTCGAKTLTKGTAPSGITWYWQGTNANGTLTTNSAPTFSANASGTYYLRARANTSGCWSNASSIAVSVNPTPPAPTGAINVTAEACGSKTMTIQGPPPSGNTWFWFGTDPVNTSYSNATSPYIVHKTGRYYIKTLNNSTGCWSDPFGVDIVVNEIPGTPTATISTNICGNKTITRGTPPAGVTWYWQTTTDGTSITNSAATLGVIQTGIYYLRARSTSGCWSLQSLRLEVTVYPASKDAGGPVFTLPTSPTVCSGGSVNITPTSSNVVSYLWFDNSNGNLLGEGGSIIIPSIYQPLSLKVQGFDANGCFSEKTLSVQTVAIPTTNPTLPKITKTGNQYYLDINNTNTAALSYFWQTKPDGVEVATFVNPRPVTPGFYYVRVRNSSNCWGPYTVIEIPDVLTTDPELLTDKTKVNYIRTYAYLNNNLNTKDPELLEPEEGVTTTKYFDGLGRQFQEVTKKASPLKFDLVKPISYDIFGRERLSYLPYVAASSSGEVQLAPFTSLRSFYRNSPKVAITDFPFLVNEFEASPMDRLTAKVGQGEAWAGTAFTTTSKGQKNFYGVNLAIDAVKKFTLSNAGTWTVGSYAVADLFLNKTLDENGSIRIDVVNKSGKPILKRIYSSGTEVLDTYYLYNDIGNLIYVLPPECVALWPATAANIPNHLNTYAFSYKYDSRNRVVEKKVPGSDVQYIIYDLRDRVVLTQSGNQRKDATGAVNKTEWSFIKYDELNRVIMSGLYTHSTVANQQEMSSQISASIFSESYNGDKTTHGYSNNVWPTSDLTVLTVNYYDNYNFLPLLINLQVFDFKKNEITGQTSAKNEAVRGKLTGSKVNILGTNNFLWKVDYYDSKYRVIQTISSNTQEGIDRNTNVYDFSGKLTRNKLNHSGIKPVTVTRRFVYRGTGRLEELYHSVDGGPEVLIAANKYNEIGQLVEKNIGGATPIQSIDYRYNTRGWISTINKSDLSKFVDDTTDPADQFGMDILYNEGL